MQAMTERFELRLDQEMLDRLDAWRSEQESIPTRAEAVRRLMDAGLRRERQSEAKISDGEKLIISLLRDIHNGLELQAAEMDPEFIMSVIWGGHAWSLPWRYPGLFHDHEDKPRTVEEVFDILEMWTFIERSYRGLSGPEQAKLDDQLQPIGADAKFRGFDGNYESAHLGVASFVVNKLDRYETFKGRDLNSHFPALHSYRRMLKVFDPLRSALVTRDLSVAELVRVLKARNAAHAEGA
ncbi:MAG: YfbU family protein [Rhodospirillales bacterium]